MAENREAKTAGIGRYLLFAFAISWVIFIIASVLTLAGYTAFFSIFSAIGMFGPMLSVLIICKGLKKEKTGIAWKPSFKGKIGWWVASWIGPIVISVLGTIFYYVVFPARLDPTCTSYFTAQYGAEYAAKAAASLTPAIAIASGCVNALLGAVINTLFAIGEETGWRGYLYPRLKARFGTTSGRIIGGAIWGCWHWPVMVLVGYEYSLSIFNAPWYMVIAGMLAFCVVCIALGTLLDLLYEKTGCIWAPALAHGAFNASAGMGLVLLVADYADQFILGPSVIGMVAGIPLFLAAALVWIMTAKKKA